MITSKVERAQATAAATDGRVMETAGAAARGIRLLPVESLTPDEGNRTIDESDEEFGALADSIRVLGVLQPLHVRELGDHFQIIDGERRWRACRRIGLREIPCQVWPAGSTAQETLVAGVVLNEQRQAHRCIHVARRLREVKNTSGLTMEQVSAQVGIPLDRVKTYSALFGASDQLLAFFEGHDVPLKVAAEMMRFEKATNEAKARQLVERYRKAPLGREEIVALRKRAEKARAPSSVGADDLPRARKPFLNDRARAEFKRDPAAAIGDLQEFLAPFGYLVVEDASHVGGEA
jgi:ParB family chromosome partitioning protein